MIEWTESARRVLNEYCMRSKTVLAGSGVDADEVSDDLRRHVEEEVRSANLSVVTEADIRRILAKVGEPQGAAAESRSATEADDESSGKLNHFVGFILVAFGVLLPLITLVFESISGASAGVLFDPIPNWFQLLAVASVPVLNAWIWWAGVSRDNRRARLLGWLNGAVTGVSLFYAIMYVPFIPFAAIGVIFFGLGLIPLSPLLATLVTPALRARYRRRIGLERLPGGFRGAAIAFALLCIAQLPTAVTYYGLAKASDEDAEIKAQGIRVLRQFGDDEMLLRASYGLLRREMDLDIVRWLASGNRTVSANEAREIYYRVTGEPFNSVRPPSLYTRAGRWADLDEEFTWDEALGGDAVAQRVKGLSLLSSRMDAVAEPDASLVYCEWTMEFKNVHQQPREARAQVALPPGAVVSRVTLWIDGEEREAAFGGRTQVREAYKEVAVAQRRDPILVTTCGPDRVLMQCFPVPARGGVMKVKLGITAPLVLSSPDRGQFVWPRFLERNFAIGADLKHDLWIESSRQLADGKAETAKPVSPDRPFALRDSLKEAELTDEIRTVTVQRSADVKDVWTPSSDGDMAIRQRIEPGSVVGIKRLVIVVDGSKGMKNSAWEISEAIASLPNNLELKLLIAGDFSATQPAGTAQFEPERVEAIQRRLQRAGYEGGQDNLTTLATAWDMASAVEGGAVLWVHGAEPVLLSAESGLLQRFERNLMRTRLFELQTDMGPDRIVEKLDGYSSFRKVPRLGSLREDLKRLFDQWSGAASAFELKREVVTGNQTGLRVGRHIERLWARDETLRLANARQSEEAIRLAVKNQVVTPLTGAVVLERKEQYERHGLTPAAANTVPSVPEPSVFSLVGVGIFAFVLFRRKRAQARRTT